MNKTVCDICGSDCSNEEYFVPMYNGYYGMNRGVRVCNFECAETTKVNICEDCKSLIAATIRQMKNLKR